jgi:hypothetical protein
MGGYQPIVTINISICRLDDCSQEQLIVDHCSSEQLIVDHCSSEQLIADHCSSEQLIVDHCSSEQLMCFETKNIRNANLNAFRSQKGSYLRRQPNKLFKQFLNFLI